MVEGPQMTERDKIMGRIREALTVSAPMPGHVPVQVQPAKPGHATGGVRQWLPAVGETFEDRIALFRANATELKAAFHLVADREELGRRLRELSKAEGWARIATHGDELTLYARATLDLPFSGTDAPYDVQLLEKCDAGITACDALIAQTGSVLVTGRSAGGRALSVLPPHHVVIARREQLLPDLPAAFDLLKQKYAPDYPAFISFITGPSRTGDIERILVLGAHGPKKLTIFCL
jgi:L-lactate dehydrogenase complex protein LldG